MTADLEALLTALYVLIDDHVIPSAQRRPGRPKKLSDAELACLAVAQVLLGARSEHHWLRLCYARLGHLFPYLPKQPGYHKRLKAAGPLLAAVMDYLARECPSWHDQVRLIDATPVPCGDFAGDGQAVRAGRVGRLRVLRGAFALVLGPEAVPAHHPGRDARRLVPGQPEDRGTRGGRRAARARRPHRRAAAGTDPHRRTRASPAGTSRTWSPPGSGCAWSARTAATRHPATGRSAGSASGSNRSTTPSKASSTWNDTAAAPPQGVYARIAQRLLAMAAAIWHNWATAEPVKRR